MRVVVANNYYYLRGGAERVMFNDIRALAEDGVEVIPFSAEDPANTPGSSLPDFARGADVHAAAPLRRMGAAVESIHCGRAARAFAALLEKYRPDVVHFHNIYGRLSTAVLPVPQKLGIPSVLTTHDYKVVCPSYLMLRDGKPCSACLDGGYYRCAVHKCHKGKLAESLVYSIEAYHSRNAGHYAAVTAFLCPSRFVADLLVQSGIDRSRVVYQPNSIDALSYEPRYGGEYALYAGRLSHEKGIATLIDAVIGTGIPLRIAGTGPLEPELRKRVLDSSGTPPVFEGHCDGSRLADLYRNAAFVVVPSEWYENAPMVILEAFACGKPVVAARIGGIAEMVDEGETGRLFSSGNRHELREVLTHLWSQPAEQWRMGRNARQTVESKFSQERRTESLRSIYQSLISGDLHSRSSAVLVRVAHQSG